MIGDPFDGMRSMMGDPFDGTRSMMGDSFDDGVRSIIACADSFTVEDSTHLSKLRQTI